MKNDTLTNQGFKYIAKGYKPLCSTEKGLLTYHKHALYIYDGNGFQKLIVFPAGLKDKLMSCNRILERMARSEPYSAAVLDDIVFVALRNRIIQISMKSKCIVAESSYRKMHIHLRRLVLINNVSGFNDCLAYGEYFSNEKHESVSIYCTVTINGHYEWKKVFTFSDNTIRHIHSLVPDPANSCVYIFTGDNDKESGIWRATDGFKTVEPFFTGDQKYRAGTAFVRGNSMFYATDSPCRSNMIAKINTKSGTIEHLSNFPGSCTSACMADDILVFCSTVEPEEPKSHGKKDMIKYYFSRKLASGMADNCAHLYIENESEKFTDILQCQKDLFPGPLCQFGRIIPQYVKNEDTLFLYFVGVKKYDGKLYAIHGIKNKPFYSF